MMIDMHRVYMTVTDMGFGAIDTSGKRIEFWKGDVRGVLDADGRFLVFPDDPEVIDALQPIMATTDAATGGQDG